ncbi:aminotransferase class III-fold pyridoxal phosphate-dependent enzyme [Streptomyces fagopyri]|uniref:Aminotransferase class III-fold pyridoxal phosphate-dependent enzyme n=1 Tax=Streptomyces fagopyri TaxID=2662397 RepID=A0A5Q0L5G7_9ACTN|nr:aminotransferase class III-fold pyridoxal phosphate-dependent enzyme [Streptomyces fagopyri]
MGRTFFANSGAEANGSAFKLAWYYHQCLARHGRLKTLSPERGYHGTDPQHGWRHHPRVELLPPCSGGPRPARHSLRPRRGRDRFRPYLRDVRHHRIRPESWPDHLGHGTVPGVCADPRPLPIVPHRHRLGCSPKPATRRRWTLRQNRVAKGLRPTPSRAKSAELDVEGSLSS